MNPQVQLNNKPEYGDMLGFTLSGVNVSLSNAIRRTMLSDIPMVVFRTSPYEQSKANIITNTSRLNNEVIKQRLSCIPIHINMNELADFPIENYIMEVNVENNTDTIMFITTEDFTIKDIVTNNPIGKEKLREIFPANDFTGDFIDFVRLRPRVSDELPGEKLHLTCKFDIGTAKEDGMFNAVSTCSYGFTIDTTLQDAELARQKQTWKDEGKTEDEIKFDAENWKLLDGLRITKRDSYDFIVQSVGVYKDSEIIDKACEILITKLDELDTTIEKDELEIINSQNTMSNCFDIILENEDYTIGKVLEYFLYTKYYETKMLTFCGFKKMHPHDNDSIIRVAYTEPVEKATIKGHMKECIADAKYIFGKIKKELSKLYK
jgi:DNA-directed RNA polymerase subunit L